MKRSTIFIGILVIIAIALYASAWADTSNVIQVNLEDSLTITDSVESTTNGIVTGADCWKKFLYNEPCTINMENPQRDLIGNIVSSEDGTTCWMIEEKIGTLYYKLIGDCPNA